MTDAAESHSVYSQIWSSLALSSCGEVLDRDGVLLITAGGKWPVMNTAFLTRPVATKADLQDRILLAKRYYAPKKALWLFILFNEWLDYSTEAEQIFSMNGLCHVQDCIGMQAKGLLEPRNSAPELTFRLVKRRR